MRAITDEDKTGFLAQACGHPARQHPQAGCRPFISLHDPDTRHGCPNSPIIWLQNFRLPMTQSLKELLAAKAALDMEIAKARTSAAEAALSKVQKLVTDFGFTQQQVFPYIPAKTSAPAKYRDPSTGATWTGRGKPPNWIKDQDRDDFLIERKPEAAQGPFLAEMAAAAARN